MKEIDNIKYEKITYQNYQTRIDKLFQKENLLKLGLNKKTLAKTEYGYNLDCITIGNGNNDLFIVAGTHGSEIISIDFVTQLIEKIDNLNNFDPNIFKIYIIPIQNPEGFDISSSVFNNININNYEKSSYEYYLRYRTDNLIINTIKDLNLFLNNLINNKNIVSPNELLYYLKHYIKTNKKIKILESNNAMPKIKIFNKLLLELPTTNSYKELKIKLLNICDITISKLNPNNLNDSFLKLFLLELKKYFNTKELWETIENNNQIRLYQEMFAKCKIKNLQSSLLEKDINKIYKLYKHPNGSQIGHDSTGIGINLNANNKHNPGILSTKTKSIIWGLVPKSNIQNYVPGPIGTPSYDPNEFEYAIENKTLYKLIENSYQKGSYLMTLLYHGTGGLIYYKPYQDMMNDNTYNKYYDYNKTLANIYSRKTNYTILEESGKTGYGDLLRRTYPGVLLIELSKMGGNPIGPYGDHNNIYITINDNLAAINDIFKYLKKEIKAEKKYSK